MWRSVSRRVTCYFVILDEKVKIKSPRTEFIFVCWAHVFVKRRFIDEKVFCKILQRTSMVG